MTSEAGPVRYVWGLLRLALGWTFLWAFLDKMFGLGFATCRNPETAAIDYVCDSAMIQGGSPTYGFLTFATEGSHTGFLFDWMAPSSPDSINLADVLFMLSLLAIGVSLLLGIAVKLGGLGGALMLSFMYLAGAVWPTNNPFMDEHIIEALVCVGFILVPAGRTLGLGRKWETIPIVQRTPWLR
jgi:thiosulfate dehydrogenase [quinone] large subunit